MTPEQIREVLGHKMARSGQRFAAEYAAARRAAILDLATHISQFDVRVSTTQLRTRVEHAEWDVENTAYCSEQFSKGPYSVTVQLSGESALVLPQLEVDEHTLWIPEYLGFTIETPSLHLRYEDKNHAELPLNTLPLEFRTRIYKRA